MSLCNCNSQRVAYSSSNMIKEILFVVFAFLAITTADPAKETQGDGVQQVEADPLKQLAGEVDDFETAESAYGGGYNRGHGHYGGHRGGHGHYGGHGGGYGGHGGHHHRGHGYYG